MIPYRTSLGRARDGSLVVSLRYPSASDLMKKGSYRRQVECAFSAIFNFIAGRSGFSEYVGSKIGKTGRERHLGSNLQQPHAGWLLGFCEIGYDVLQKSLCPLEIGGGQSIYCLIILESHLRIRWQHL